MQPWVLSAIAAWARAAARHSVQIVGVENAHTARYAWRFGLLDFVEGWVFEEPPVVAHEEAGRFVPLKQVRSVRDIPDLIADIAPLLHLAGDREQALAVQYVMSEMVRNVLEHSRSPDGALVCAQLYPGKKSKRSYVSVGVADCGIGVRSSLARNFPDLESDADALLTAIRLGTTGASGEEAYGSSDNAGGGLFFTRRLSEATGGYFGLASKSALFRTTRAQRALPDARLVSSIGTFPGTIVAIEIGLDQPINFEDFMSDTRETFLAAAAQSSQRAARLVSFT